MRCGSIRGIPKRISIWACCWRRAASISRRRANSGRFFRSIRLTPRPANSSILRCSDQCAEGSCAEDAIAGVAEPRKDISLLVQLPIDRRAVNGNFRMLAMAGGDAFRGGDEADEL